MIRRVWRWFKIRTYTKLLCRFAKRLIERERPEADEEEVADLVLEFAEWLTEDPAPRVRAFDENPERTMLLWLQNR